MVFHTTLNVEEEGYQRVRTVEEGELEGEKAKVCGTAFKMFLDGWEMVTKSD